LAIQELINLKTTINKIPTVAEYDDYAKTHDLIRRRNLEIRLGMKWSAICKTYLGDTNQKQKTKEEIYNELLKLKSELGRSPIVDDLRDRNIGFKQCYRAYGMTFNQMIKSFGWEISGHRYSKKSIDELCEDYIKLYEKLGRVPEYEDIDNEEDMSPSQVYRKKLGTIVQICEFCNIDTYDYRKSDAYLLFDKEGNSCLSKAELKISNYLIDHNIKFTKEKMYKHLISDFDKLYRFDWYVEETNVCIEYFGLYNSSASAKKVPMIKNYIQRTNEKIEICNNNGVNLVSLYPSDMKNKMKGVKEKLFFIINHKP